MKIEARIIIQETGVVVQDWVELERMYILRRKDLEPSGNLIFESEPIKFKKGLQNKTLETTIRVDDEVRKVVPDRVNIEKGGSYMVVYRLDCRMEWLGSISGLMTH